VAFFIFLQHGGGFVCTLLVIDNYDSFTFNLVQMFRRYPLDVKVYRNDRIDSGQAEALAPDYILISPGPKDPAHSGISMAVIRQWHRRVPVLGVCLGMQCINEVFGGSTIRSAQPLHGKTSAVHHDGTGLFAGVPSPFRAARYHSLAVSPDDAALQDDLRIAARAEDGTIMGLAHRRFALWGVQFHPESFMTEYGFALIENFLTLGPLKLVPMTLKEMGLDARTNHSDS
jgi:anthranilate synthase/aminodeoxychorismate synthase-like glutamine amidotransferase